MNDQPTDWIIRTDDASPAPSVKAELLPLEDEPEPAQLEAEPDEGQLDDSYVRRLIAQRCPELDGVDLGKMFALPPEIAELLMAAISAIEDKVGELEQRIEEAST